MGVKVTSITVKPADGLFFRDVSAENAAIVQDNIHWTLSLPGCIGFKTTRDWINNSTTTVVEWTSIEDFLHYQQERITLESFSIIQTYNIANTIFSVVDREET